MEFVNYFLEVFPKGTELITYSLKLSIITLIWPLKIVFFSLHNLLTGRDYTYSLDDISDLVITIVISVWLYTYILWSNRDRPKEVNYAASKDEIYFYNIL